MNFTIGCDPEIFLVDQQKNFRSVIGLLGGDKWFPRVLSDRGHACLEDNVAVEFNIPPCNSLEEFRTEVKAAMQMVKDILPPDLDYDTNSAVSFPESELQDERSWIFGCEPDYNVWTMEENPKPHSPDRNLRSAGGHIHIGADIAKEDPVAVARAMDVFVGVPSTVQDTSPSSQQRRALYGKAGCVRIKPYGLEYRTLSNYWIFSDEMIQKVYEGTKRALEFVASGKRVAEEHGELINECINNNNKDAYVKLQQLYAV